RLALLKQRLLIRFGCGIFVQRQLQLSAVRLLGRGHGQPAVRALAEIGLLGKAQYLSIEAQGLVLVVHIYACHFDLHFVSPSLISRFGPAGGLLAACQPPDMNNSSSIKIWTLKLHGPPGYPVFPFSSFSLALLDLGPCDQGGVREHPRERTRTGGTAPASHPPPEMVQASAGRDGAVRLPWIQRNRLRA